MKMRLTTALTRTHRETDALVHIHTNTHIHFHVDFGILSQTGISVTGVSSVTGDIGVSPIASTAITGFGLILDSSTTFSTSSVVTGKVWAASYTAPTPAKMTQAISDMGTAFEEATGRVSPDFIELGAGSIESMTLAPGLYKWGTGVAFTSGCLLSGSSAAVWVFQIAQDLIVGNGAILTLTGGALASNIFWQVSGAVSLGTTSQMHGTILSKTAIIFNTGARLTGIALAQTAVTLDASTVVKTAPASLSTPSSSSSPVDCVRTTSAFGTCSTTCGSGTQTRTTSTVQESNGGLPCTAAPSLSQSCDLGACPAPVACVPLFSEYGMCSVTCGGGFQTRTWSVGTAASNGGAECNQATYVLSQACETQACPAAADCVPLFTAYTTCPVSCGGGIQTRTFSVLTAATGTGTACLASNYVLSRACNIEVCPIAVACVPTFSTFTACDKTCGPGFQTRTWSVTTPASDGGAICDETKYVLSQACQDVTCLILVAVPVVGARTIVNLRSAGNYVILAKAGISVTGVTKITGDIAVSPIAATALTGLGLTLDPTTAFATSPTVVGQVFAASYTEPTPTKLTAAVSDMLLAFDDAAGRVTPDFSELGAGNVDGLTLVPGLYKWGTGLKFDVGCTLNGGASSIWIFQIAQNLSVGSGAILTLAGGARASNIFWQVSGSTVLGSTAQFHGVILSKTSIVFKTGATLNGFALAQTAVTLDATTVVKPGAATAGVDQPNPALNVIGGVISSPGNFVTSIASMTIAATKLCDITCFTGIQPKMLNCHQFDTVPSDSVVLKVTTGTNVAYFKPASGQTLCTLLTAGAGSSSLYSSSPSGPWKLISQDTQGRLGGKGDNDGPYWGVAAGKFDSGGCGHLTSTDSFRCGIPVTLDVSGKLLIVIIYVKSQIASTDTFVLNLFHSCQVFHSAGAS